MRTPKNFTDNINKGIITEEMLELSLFSVNKRAKNHRDRAREVKQMYRNDWYGTVDREYELSDDMYELKDSMLEMLTPIGAHYTYRSSKSFSDYYSYEELVEEYGSNVHIYTKYNMKYNEVSTYYKVYGRFKECYLVYKVGNHTFHTIVSENNKYYQSFIKSGQIEELHDFTTYGADVSDLISMQFVKKLVRLIESGNYTYIAA